MNQRKIMISVLVVGFFVGLAYAQTASARNAMVGPDGFGKQSTTKNIGTAKLNGKEVSVQYDEAKNQVSLGNGKKISLTSNQKPFTLFGNLYILDTNSFKIEKFNMRGRGMSRGMGGRYR